MSWNTELAYFLLSGGEHVSSPDLISTYGGGDVDVESIQKKKFADFPEMLRLYTDIELPLAPILRDMHEHGILIDRTKMASLLEAYSVRRESLAKTITDVIGPCNLNSPKQLGTAIVDTLHITLPKTKTGQYTTNYDALIPYASTHAVIQNILDHKSIDKVIHTYISPILEKLDASDRIHPLYDQMSAATGRLASTDPNIQSTPATGEYGEAIRSCFIAPKGSVLIALDYSQQELRILAHLSQDATLRDAFTKGVDVHVLTASEVLGIPVAQVGKAERNIGKTLNFGIVYGETAYGLSRQLSKSPEECTGILRRYFETYAGVKKYFDNLLLHAKLHGFVETILGRRRGIPGQRLYATAKYIPAAGERILKNFPIQGSAADMTKAAMISTANDVLPSFPEAHLVMQIHDELVFEFSTTDETRIKDFITAAKSSMERAIPLTVPVIVDAKAGQNWGEI